MKTLSSYLTYSPLQRLGFGVAALFVAVALIFQWISGPDTAISSPSPLPEEEPRNLNWVSAHEDNRREFGTMAVVLPSQFTDQGGATVIGNAVVVPVEIGDQSKLLPGTLFALGIWPPNDQLKYQKPIQVSFTLNAAQISPGNDVQLAIMQYLPSEKRWLPLKSEFSRATYTISAETSEMTPVATDFPYWGGRTFFAVAQSSSAPATTSDLPVTIRRANIRSGPGISFLVLRVTKPGEIVTPLYISEDGRWLMLNDKTWIAAFLVKNVPADLPIFDYSSDESAVP